MVGQDMKRRPLDWNARSLKANTQLSENIVNEAFIARVVCQPVHNVVVGKRGSGIDAWRRTHFLLLSGPGSTILDMSCPNSTASTKSRPILLTRVGFW
jgi:hypothetical protein